MVRLIPKKYREGAWPTSSKHQLGKRIWDLCKAVNNKQKQMSFAAMLLSIQVVPTSKFSHSFFYYV